MQFDQTKRPYYFSCSTDYSHLIAHSKLTFIYQKSPLNVEKRGVLAAPPQILSRKFPFHVRNSCLRWKNDVQFKYKQLVLMFQVKPPIINLFRLSSSNAEIVCFCVCVCNSTTGNRCLVVSECTRQCRSNIHSTYTISLLVKNVAHYVNINIKKKKNGVV